MNKKRSILIGLTFILLMAGCNLPGSGTPTPRPEAVYTSAAQTVAAALTSQAPKTSATNTPLPQLPTLPPIIQPSPASPTSTSPPLATVTITAPAVADKAQWVSQSPADGSSLVAGTQFKTVWTLKNIGPTTWTTKYYLRPFIQQAFGGPAQVFLSTSVKPNEQISIEVPMVAPTDLGEAKTIWVLANEQGVNFYPLYLTIKVVEKPTVTPTSATTQTSTPGATTTPTK